MTRPGGFFSDTAYALPPLQLGPDLRGGDVGIHPQNDKMIENISTFSNQLMLASGNGLDETFDGFLAEFLGDLSGATGQEAG
ncbi:hypothetical protein AA21952_2072 [Acetobacter oeni LMG 21952]|nr:hypothetical protein AA21952_2072 [Acetobacter oeni LMG 21952]